MRKKARHAALALAGTLALVYFNHPSRWEIFWLSLGTFGCLLYGLSDWALKQRLSVAEKMGRWIILFVACCFAVLLYAGHFSPEPAPITRPSFPYLAPGVVLNNNAWDFLLRHKGPNTNQSIQVLFTDQAKQQQVLDEHKKINEPLTVAEINSYSHLIQYPEANPHCRGRIFADQLLWSSPNFDHERYSFEIMTKEMNLHHDLGIERVAGKWYDSAEVKDTDSGKVLLKCRDQGFPGSQPTDVACFPAILSCDE
jgi:hypothetical protein